MPIIRDLGELGRPEADFAARIVLEETQKSPEHNRWIRAHYSVLFPHVSGLSGQEYVLGSPIQEIRLTNHVSRPDLATLLKDPDYNHQENILTAFMSRALGLTPEAEQLLNAVQEGIEERHVYDPDNFYPPTTAPDKLRLRILQVLDETREKLGRYPHELLKIERMIGMDECRQFLYAYGGGERFCEREKEALLGKGYALDEACHDVF